MIKIGLLGLGTVGGGVYKIMEKNRANIAQKVGDKVEIKKILVNSLNKKRDINIEPELMTNSSEAIIQNPEIDLVVELIGGEKPAHEFIVKSLKHGKSVVTANKLVIAKYGREIFKLAGENGLQVSYEGSVAGGLPIVRPLKESLAANRIKSIYGILNGTTNYILTRMTESGIDFDQVLQEAQKRGYAEKNPASDINGRDAAYKISILSSLAFETFIDVKDVYIEGIQGISPADIETAAELGYVIKLIAIGKKREDGIDVRVHPAFVSRNHPLALVNDVYNAVYLQGDAVGDVMSYGRGAGRMPTGSSVVADIIQVARDIYYKRTPSTSASIFEEYNLVSIDEIENRFYLRLQVNDEPGVMSRVTKILGDNGVSLASVIQRHRLSPVVPLILITHPVQEKFMQKSLQELKALDDVVSIASTIRVEGDEE